MLGLILMLGSAGQGGATAASAGPEVSVQVSSYALVAAAPVPDGFAMFALEAAELQPTPRAGATLDPETDQRFYALRRSVERMARRQTIARDWSQSNRAGLNFGDEISRIAGLDGLAYAVEGELVTRVDRLVPLGVRLSGAAGHRVRYAVGLAVADQMVMIETGELGGSGPLQVQWMVQVRPSGPADAAVPVRAVVAIQGEGASLDERRQAVATVSGGLISSADGRLAVSERGEGAAEWLAPLPAFLKPDQVAAPLTKAEKAAKKKQQKKKSAESHGA